MTFRLKNNLPNEPGKFDMPGRLLAISDIEGNFLSFRRLLLKNGVIDNKYRWTYGEGHVVILGDCFDRGDQVAECLWLIYSLEEKARKEGGYVHFILGNHEIMNLNGDWRYVHPKYADSLSSKQASSALYGGNSELWKWLCTKNIVETIGDILLIHGGISREILNLDLQPTEINERVRPFYNRATELFSDPLLFTVFNSDQSPFWYRGYYQSTPDEKLIDDTLAYFSVNTIVTGHTVSEKVIAHYDGKVINIDTNNQTDTLSALLIKKGRFYSVDSYGKKERIK
jgi:hypothetical protein